MSLAKITLLNLNSGYQSVSQLNANLQLIEDALNDAVLYRVNPSGETNTMSNALDMNSNRITNLPTPANSADAARWVDVTDSVELTGQAVPNLTGNSDKYIGNDGTSLLLRRPGEIYFCVDTDTVADALKLRVDTALAVNAKHTAPAEYRVGQMVVFTPGIANTGATTLFLYDADDAALAAKSLKYKNAALPAGFLSTSYIYVAVYDGTEFEIVACNAAISDMIPTSSVVTAKIADDAVTLDKIDGDASFANKVIGYDASGDPTNITVGRKLIGSGSISAAASLEFILSTLDTAQATTNMYEIFVTGIRGTDGENLLLTVGDSGAYASATYKYALLQLSTTPTTSQVTSGSAASVPLASGVGSASADEYGVMLRLLVRRMNTGTSLNPIITADVSFISSSGLLASSSGSLTNSTADTYDRIKLAWSASNTEASGYYAVYKVN